MGAQQPLLRHPAQRPARGDLQDGRGALADGGLGRVVAQVAQFGVLRRRQGQRQRGRHGFLLSPATATGGRAILANRINPGLTR
jgi:hypothetical protein